MLNFYNLQKKFVNKKNRRLIDKDYDTFFQLKDDSFEKTNEILHFKKKHAHVKRVRQAIYMRKIRHVSRDMNSILKHLFFQKLIMSYVQLKNIEI